MSDLIEQVERNLGDGLRVPARGRILVAVSGGLDSMVLLHVLHGIAASQSWTVVVAHLNHQLRGRSSDADAQFVRAQCRGLKVPCVVGRRAVRSFAKRRKLSIEMAAREARHEFLARVAQQRGCSTITLAHHADDQAELVLMRLLRGAGSEGLGGMKARSCSPVDSSIQLVRPLLTVGRAEIAAFAKEAGIRFREDRSNQDRRYLRNRIRHELLPLLRSDYQSRIGQVLTRTASVLSAEADCIRNLACRWLAKPDISFGRLPIAVRRRVIHLQAMACGVVLDFESCEKLVGRANRTVSAPGGELLRRDSAGRVSRQEPVKLSHSQDSCRVRLGIRGQVEFGGRLFKWTVGAVPRRGRRIPLGQTTEVFDATAIGSNLVLRHWRPGDRFQPIGMDRRVKLQDLFTNLKVPVNERRTRVVVEAESGEIAWVEGLRIGDPFKLVPASRKRLVWRWKC